MKNYIGVKNVRAKHMGKLSFENLLEGKENDHDIDNSGYLVEYLNSPSEEFNHLGFENYISWSPESVFDRCYKESNITAEEVLGAIHDATIVRMHDQTIGDFGWAISALKRGEKVCRRGWNGKGMWIVYMSGMSLPPYSTQDTHKKVNDRTAKLIGEDTPLETLPYLAMWTADKKWLPGWLASQSDMLAEDWEIA